jgi:hypothetical protein
MVVFGIDGNQMTTDDWIKQDEYEVKMEVSPQELDGAEETPDKTEVEFYSDHVAVYPPHHELDGEVIDKLKLLLENYYLLGDQGKSVIERLNTGSQ